MQKGNDMYLTRQEAANIPCEPQNRVGLKEEISILENRADNINRAIGEIAAYLIGPRPQGKDSELQVNSLSSQIDKINRIQEDTLQLIESIFSSL